MTKEHLNAALENLVLDMKLAVELDSEDLRVTATIVNNHRFAETVGESIGPEDLPFTPLVDEAYAQHIRETVGYYQAIFENGRP